MSRLLKELLATAAMLSCEQLSGGAPYRTNLERSYNHKYTPKYKLPTKELHEFTIKGKTIMATSRKDAIKNIIINTNNHPAKDIKQII